MRLWTHGIGTDPASLHIRVRRIEAELRDIQQRIAALRTAAEEMAHSPGNPDLNHRNVAGAEMHHDSRRRVGQG